MTDLSLEERLNKLEACVLDISKVLLYIVHSSSHMDYDLLDKVLDLMSIFKDDGPVIKVSKDHKHIPFYRRVYEGDGWVKRPISVRPMSSRVTRLLMDAGYHSLKDLNGVALVRICIMPGVGPAAIREFTAFLAQEEVLFEREHK